MVTITVPATVNPISLENAKLFLREKDSDEDALIQRLIRAATHWWQNFTGQLLIDTTVEQTQGGFSSPIVLQRNPVSAVTSIQYVDGDGNTQTVDSGDYALENGQAPACIKLVPDATWPDSSDVTVTYVAGYGATEDDVPEDIRHALDALVALWFDNRAGLPTVGLGAIGNIDGIPHGIQMAAWSHRVYEYR